MKLRYPSKLDPKKDSNALLRLFATSALISIVVIIGLAGYGLRGVLQHYVIRAAEDDAISVSRALLAEERDEFLVSLEDGSFRVEVALDDLPRLDRRMRAFLAPFGIVKIKIYSDEGRIVYSTENRLIGVVDRNNVRLDNALAGNFDSKFEKKEEVKDLSHELKFDVDVVETYIPIRDLDGKVIGSFEVYLDVNKYREQSKAAVTLFLGILTLILVTVYGLSFLFIRKGTGEVKAIQETLRKQTLTDPLTGISNKRHIVLTAQKEFARASRRRRKGLRDVDLGLVMLDVDRFKQINDGFGHLAGDLLLRQLAGRISASVRGYDTVGRFGGEEFLVVLPGADLEQTRRVANKICRLIRETPFLLEGKEVPVTASLGVAAATEADTDYTQVLKRADEALYSAKNGGRDQVLG